MLNLCLDAYESNLSRKYFLKLFLEPSWVIVIRPFQCLLLPISFGNFHGLELRLEEEPTESKLSILGLECQTHFCISVFQRISPSFLSLSILTITLFQAEKNKHCDFETASNNLPLARFEEREKGENHFSEQLQKTRLQTLVSNNSKLELPR